MRTSSALFALLFGSLLVRPGVAQGHAREGAEVIADRDAMQDSALWIYNDVDAGLARAKATGKPLLVGFR